MKLEFLGTRGNTETRTQRHWMHSSVRVSYQGQAVVIDCGEDWLGKLSELDAQAVVITHAHPDHAWGLKDGAPCPVYATEEAWEDIGAYGIEDGRTMPVRDPTEVGSMRFEAFPVLHSTRAPAVGYRVTAGRVAIFYVPDVAWITDRQAALQGVTLYVGDGATVARSMIRKPGDVIIGHVPIRTQLTWCQKERVSRAVFTHCGSEILRGDDAELEAEIASMASERGIEAEIASDGLALVLR